MLTYPGIGSCFFFDTTIAGAMTGAPVAHFGWVSYAPGGGPGGDFTGRKRLSGVGANELVNLGFIGDVRDTRICSC
jgi:hypothetical protein